MATDDSDKRCLNFNNRNKKGIIALPNCNLILEYEQNLELPNDFHGKENISKNIDKRQIKITTKTIKQIIDELIELLDTSEDLRLCDLARREQLLRDLNIREKNEIKNGRHEHDMHIDNTAIVDNTEKILGKLDIIISNAKGLAINKLTKNKLDSLLRAYNEIKSRETTEKIEPISKKEPSDFEN